MAPDVQSIAQIALAVLWGGALCGLGAQAAMSTLSAFNMRRGDDGKDAMGVTAIFLVVCFIAALLYTLSVADIFHASAWLQSLQEK